MADAKETLAADYGKTLMDLQQAQRAVDEQKAVIDALKKERANLDSNHHQTLQFLGIFIFIGGPFRFR